MYMFINTVIDIEENRKYLQLYLFKLCSLLGISYRTRMNLLNEGLT